MRIVPVIDLVGGQVVRGVGGRRDEYRPLQSWLCPDSGPESMAAALVAQLSLREAYLADLDAIASGEPAWNDYRRIADCGLSLWIDAGLRQSQDAARLVRFDTGAAPITGIIAGLETVHSLVDLQTMCELVGPKRLIFSLDLKDGRPLAGAPELRRLAPEQIAGAAIELGIRRMIVLDLARVGSGAGAGTETLCRAIRKLAPGVELIGGGGVRGRADLDALKAAGCDAALVASALHDGRLTAKPDRASPETP